MNKKLLVIYGIVLMMAFAAVIFPVAAESNNPIPRGRYRVTAIGTFELCETDGVLYGHIVIGIKGFKPVFFYDFEIGFEAIRFIIMSNHFLHCVYIV
jgi:hypothetical protein